MSNKLNRKEEEILRKQRALYSEISKHKDKPPPPPPATSASSKTIPNHSKPASLSELLSGKPHQRKQPPPTTTSTSTTTTMKPLHSIQSMAILKKKGTTKDVVDLTADDSPEKMTMHTKETSIVIDKPFGKISSKPMPSSSSSSSSSIQHKQQGNISSTNVKRPSIRKRKQMDAAIDAARQRIKDASTIMEQKQISNDTISSKTITSTTTTTTTTMNPTKKNGGGLASLLNQAGITNKQLHTKASAQISWVEEEDRQGSLLEVEDYFKCMRTWDFLKDWNRERFGTMDRGGSKPLLTQESSNQMKEGDEEEMQTMNSQVLPDIFTSRKQYQTLWAPLCLQEAKAQILSDASSSLPWKNANESRENGTGTKKRGNIYSPVPVVVRPKAQNSNLYSESLSIQIESDMKVQGMSFGAGDIIVLACKESDFTDASKGKLKIPKASSSCIVGNVEYSRRALDGLKVIVSRQCWFRLCKDKVEMKMYLLNLGSSVTNLREFTALCRVNSIPLLPYILCRKLTRATDNLDALSNAICGNISALRKHDHLQTIGGKTALGEGFMKYASSKFNDSQLGAISAAAREYGEGGFTLVKGPPGTGKTTTLVALLNALHIRQFLQYYENVRKIVDVERRISSAETKLALAEAGKQKPRLLVCAPSNNAIDNVIQKIMESGFIDGAGRRYNPSIVRIGIGQSEGVKDVSLETKVDEMVNDVSSVGKIQNAIAGYKSELHRIQIEIHQLRRKLTMILNASDYPLSTKWEVRIDDNFIVQYVNHDDKKITLECPPPPEPAEKYREMRSMPEFKIFMGQVVKLVDRFTNVSSKLDRYTLMEKNGENLRQQLETQILDTTHIVLTTLGTAGSHTLESCSKFEVIVIDEAAQSVEPSTLVALQLGSSHAILVGDPEQLPATIFSYSGRTTKYDRSLFQRLEEAGHEVHLLDTQYRMHPNISSFPRRIFYGGYLKDGSNVTKPDYGNPLRERLTRRFPSIQPFTVFDLLSSEKRGGTSLSNSMEAAFALQIYQELTKEFGIFVSHSPVAVITPYSQQVTVLRDTFSRAYGPGYRQFVDIVTVDSFQGREANIVIFSCVRAAGRGGIGFLSDVRRMNVALTRAKHFLFVIARCETISLNPYWNQLVTHARSSNAVVSVPRSFVNSGQSFANLKTEVPGENDTLMKSVKM